MSVGAEKIEEVQEKILEKIEKNEYEVEHVYEKDLILIFEPHWFREFNDIMQEVSKTSKDQCYIEILDNAVFKADGAFGAVKLAQKKADEEAKAIEDEEAKRLADIAKANEVIPEFTYVHNCQKCPGAGFDLEEDYKTHFKTEWHVENIRREIAK